MKRLFATAVLCILGAPAFGQEVDSREQEELERQEGFRDGMTVIVEELNRGSFDRLVSAIDADEMLESIFGLRLIDQRMKRDFIEQMEQEGRFEQFIRSQYQAEAEEGIRARLLTVESRGDRGRAVVRFDMPHFQASYLEYDLRLGPSNNVQVVDWVDYGRGHRFTDRVGLAMIVQQPKETSVRKLIDFPTAQQAEVFQVMEALKATRDNKFDRFWQIIDSMDEDMRRQRVVWKVGLDAAREGRKRRDQRRVLEGIDKYHPEDVLFALPLLDYYFPDRQYQKARDALVRVRDKLRVDDALTNARLSSTELVIGNIDEAVQLAAKAIEQEPDLELGWWSQFRAQVAAGDHETAAEALTALNGTFGHDLTAETLSKEPALRDFIESEAFRSGQQQ